MISIVRGYSTTLENFLKICSKILILFRIREFKQAEIKHILNFSLVMKININLFFIFPISYSHGLNLHMNS
jgi:hypothetical protein